MMAYAFLHAMGLDGEIGSIEIDLSADAGSVSDGHELVSKQDGVWTFTSNRYPFCAEGPLDDHHSIRAGMALVPFDDELNQFTLKVSGIDTPRARVTWGEHAAEFDAATLAEGINLAHEFPVNPFCPAFQRVDEAVAAKQAFETHQIKRVFHGKEGKLDIEAAVKKTEAERQPLADAIAASFQPVTHTIRVEPIE